MNAAHRSIKVLSAVLCDEVRREQSGKDILIGVYGGEIILNNIPGPISVSLWLSLEIPHKGDFVAEIRVVNAENKELARLKAEFGISGQYSHSSFYTPRMRLDIEKPTSLKFQCRLDAERWKTVLTRDVIQPTTN